MVYKKEPAGKPDARAGEIHYPKEPGFHDEGLVCCMEYAIVNGKEYPKDPGLGPDTGGLNRSGLPFSCTGPVHCCTDGRSIGTQHRDDSEDADNDAL